ncbi:MAG: hypothetical protein ABIK93_08220 [candidate division WOR-3 bacterium]
MINPKKVWLLYAQKIYNLFCQNLDKIPVMLKNNLNSVVATLKLDLTQEQKDHLLEIALVFFREEYLEAYRRASSGEEPESELSTIQSCIVIEETTGYPVTELFQAMVRAIIANKDKPEETVVDILIKNYSAYPALAILKINLQETPRPENQLPDYCLALSVKSLVESAMGSAS